MLPGRATENVIRSTSLIPDMERKEESSMASTIRPGPPYGSSVSFNQTDSTDKKWIIMSIDLLAGMPHG
jgi:hypothetical protein